MGVCQGRKSLTLEDAMRGVSEAHLLARYFGVTQIPCVIKSPLRIDNHPSFSFSSQDGKKIFYKDFATGDRGDLLELLQKMWGTTFTQTLERIKNDTFTDIVPAFIDVETISHHSTFYTSSTRLEVKTRAWEKKDVDYWAAYGVPIELLKKAHVYPITHYFITKQNTTMTFHADKLAYAFVENKEGHPTIKVYQPYNKGRFKWVNTHDRSVLGLWTLMPKQGEVVCICSSVKDALCLTANTGIPAICLQGEAYGISQTAQEVLKERFKSVFICLDNDAPGKEDAAKLQQSTGFTNIELPQFEGGKDISDLYKVLNNSDKFKTIILNLFKNDKKGSTC